MFNEYRSAVRSVRGAGPTQIEPMAQLLRAASSLISYIVTSETSPQPSHRLIAWNARSFSSSRDNRVFDMLFSSIQLNSVSSITGQQNLLSKNGAFAAFAAEILISLGVL
jgi:hypothetical protein